MCITEPTVPLPYSLLMPINLDFFLDLTLKFNSSISGKMSSSFWTPGYIWEAPSQDCGSHNSVS